MRRLSQNLSVLAVSFLTLGTLAAQPVFAESGSSSGSGENETTTTTSTDDSIATHEGGGTGTSGKKLSPPSIAPSDLNGGGSGSGSGNLKAEAQKLLATQRQDLKKQTSVADRQKACTARQAELTTRESNYDRNAKKHLDVFNSIYTKVLAFQTAHNLTATNYAALKADADAKQAAAVSAVAAISTADTKIDCTSSDPAVAVANLKTAVSNARTALQDYRTAIKNLVVALEQVKTDSTTSTDSTTGAQ